MYVNKFPLLRRLPNNPERIAFILHRVTGLILLGYFSLHAITMGLTLYGYTGAAGAAAKIAFNSVVEWVVAVSASFHGANGVRLLLVEVLGWGLGKPGIPKPPYVSASLRSPQRIALHVVFAFFLLSALIVGYTLYKG